MKRATVSCALALALTAALAPAAHGDAALEQALSEGRGAVARVAAGETITVYDAAFAAEADSLVYFSLSSDYLAAAVLSGAIASADRVEAEAGRVLVATLDGARTERFQFDAAQLRRTLASTQIDPAAAEALALIEQRQARLKFFGLLEPVGVNAAAASPQVEPIRQSYLNEPALIRLRRQAQGDAAALARGTAQAFVDALASGAVDDVAALIDPAPFMAQSPDPVAWRAARRSFAAGLAARPSLIADMTGAQVVVGADATRPAISAASGKTYALALAPRDRALFVAALEETPQ